MENTKCSIAKTRAPAVNSKVGVSLDHGAPLRFVLLSALQTLEATFQANNNVRSVPASTAFVKVSHQSHNACTGKSSPIQQWRKEWSTKENKNKLMIQALELLQLHISGRSNVEQCKNQARSLSGYQVTLV